MCLKLTKKNILDFTEIVTDKIVEILQIAACIAFVSFYVGLYV